MLFLMGAAFIASLLLLTNPTPPESEVILVSDGTLIQAKNDYNVYYVENSKKRWIDSAETFRAHGFHWDDLHTLPATELSSYENGEVLTVNSRVVFPGEEETLPDLVPFAIEDTYLTTLNGRTILKFSSIFWNQGGGPVELIPDPETAELKGDIEHDVFQRILHEGGTYRNKLVGTFLWHAPHGHYHFSDFANYLFGPTEGGTTIPEVKIKKSRCLWDTKAVALNLKGAPSKKIFNTCKNNKERQGVSVGWADVYPHTLPDQYLDVHDAPPGIYRLSFQVDPSNRFVEQRTDNNTSVTLLNLDVQKGVVERVASAAPFPGAANVFPNGMLIQAEGGSKVYATHNNKKRWLYDDILLYSDRYSQENVHVLPRAIIDVVPSGNLIRINGVMVYMINDSGHKRPIKSIDIFNSYEFSWNDVADIDPIEFVFYPDARLVRVAGGTKVYYIDGDTLQPIQSLEVFNENGFSWDELHVISLTDFASYSVGAEITGKIE